MRNRKVIVIIPAAGLGTRMQSAPDAKRAKPQTVKQFAELGGTPILIRSVRVFAEIEDVSEIYVALRPSEIDTFRARLEKEVSKKKVQIAEGGEHRQDSVRNALAQVRASAEDIILVHDAVRPFVTPQIIHDVIAAAEQKGAAIAGVPAVDTIKQVKPMADGALITTTIPREKVVLAQTPQGFRYDVLKKAFDEAVADGFMGTDESSLVERSGHEVAVVMGSARNIKITTPADLELAEFYLKN